jgi:hypothetical protein
MVLAALALTACAQESDRPVATTHTTSVAISVDNAATQLAKARCERQAECNNIGNGPFDTQAECAHAMRERAQTSLNRVPCSAGIDQPELDKCVAVLRDEMCLSHLGPVESLVECSAKKLCAS